jgi:hypothetical protein
LLQGPDGVWEAHFVSVDVCPMEPLENLGTPSVNSRWLPLHSFGESTVCPSSRVYSVSIGTPGSSRQLRKYPLSAGKV